MSDSTPMMQQYERIKSEHGDTLLFFRLGDFYEMFRQDALDASRLLGLTLTQRNGTPMCGIPHHAVRTYVPRLLAAGRKVAICDQVGEIGKGLVERQVVQIITPGTLLDDEYLDRSSNNFLVSLARAGDDGSLALALFDMSTGDLLLESAPAARGGALLETSLAKWLPREMLVQESLLRGDPAVEDVLHGHPELLLNRFADWQYDVAACDAQLCRLMGLRSLQAFGLDSADPRLAPVAAILQYCEHTARHQLDHLRSIRVVRSSDHLELDDTSVRNLELVRNMNDGSRNFSLLDILDQTRTPMGARLLRMRLLAPLRDCTAIARRLDAVEWYYHHQETLREVRETLRSVGDVARLTNRVLLDKAHPKDVVALAAALARMLRLREILAAAGRGGDDAVLALPDTEAIAAVAAELAASLLDEPSILLTEGNIIRPGRDARVDEYRRLRDDSQSILEAYVEEERQATGIGSLRVRHNNIIGYYLEVTKSNLAAVPAHFQRKQSLVNGERYTTVRLTELEASIARASELAVERERELFLEIRGALKPWAARFLALSDAVAEADVHAALAQVATARGYCRPSVVPGRELVIKAGRHPVVEAVVGQGRFIPNDLGLGGAGTPATALITGPNMAGKSTYLRQTALIALMAHMGSFVPAEEAHIGLVDQIFCRVGASDNLARGESTFLVEMNETARILRSASADSLVIMDEVGRGTSTQDGLSIARAILEHIIGDIGCRCLFATHFHELTDVVDPRLANLSMAVDEGGGTITFLKRVVAGPSNNSYGIHVARLAGIPEPVIARADAILEALTADAVRTGGAAALSPQVPAPAVPPEALAPAAASSARPAGKAGADRRQASLFDPLDEVEAALRGFNVDRSTPLEALNAIAAWKKLLGGR